MPPRCAWRPPPKSAFSQPALDAAQTAQAGNSIEKMLTHLMTASHFAAMNLYARASGGTDLQTTNAAEQVRYMNAAARQVDTFRECALALLKLKTGGKQNVVVQHVQVNEGGKAVIAGNLSKGGAGGPTGGEEPK